ncbi:MAG: nucleotidyltransferase domain-containing protein [Proteobacteria bacterium]|nr:nucleotidyltransferase domain-containing protein [Pseudomonadota bacterium]
MPVRSLSSSVLKWPDRNTIIEILETWAIKAKLQHSELEKLGFFGSYARGDWGVGSDLDLVAIVSVASKPFEQRALSWDLSELPVPADLLIYASDEWQRLEKENNRFWHTLRQETIWLETSR